MAISVLGEGNRAGQLLSLGVGVIAGAPLESVPVSGEDAGAAVISEAGADVGHVALVVGGDAVANDGDLDGVSSGALGNFAMLDIGSDETDVLGSNLELDLLTDLFVRENDQIIAEVADAVSSGLSVLATDGEAGGLGLIGQAVATGPGQPGSYLLANVLSINLYSLAG